MPSRSLRLLAIAQNKTRRNAMLELRGRMRQLREKMRLLRMQLAQTTKPPGKPS
jgi:hypothetical protein